jgi:hypothetical protein
MQSPNVAEPVLKFRVPLVGRPVSKLTSPLTVLSGCLSLGTHTCLCHAAECIHSSWQQQMPCVLAALSVFCQLRCELSFLSLYPSLK